MCKVIVKQEQIERWRGREGHVRSERRTVSRRAFPTLLEERRGDLTMQQDKRR